MDPIKEAAAIISGEENPELERRLKQDIINSIGRIKPDIVADIDFEKEVMTGDLFPTLPAPVLGIAIAKAEGALAFYNRVGWKVGYLAEPLTTCVPEEGLTILKERYHAKTLHDLAYVHPKHFEKILGKPGAANLWETLKRYSNTAAS